MLKIIGGICLLVGIAILSPLDDILILAPLAMIWGIQVFPIAWAIGAVLTAIGIAILGTHTLVSMGIIGAAIARHPAVLGLILLATIGFIYWWSIYG